MWTFFEFGLLVACIAFWIGDITSTKTRGLFGALLIGSVIYIAGYLSGIIPTDQPGVLGLGAMMTSMNTMFIANMGSTMSINKFLEQWRVVVCCLCSMVVMAVIVYPVGNLLFDQQMAVAAIPPISGGAVASMITSDFCAAAGRDDLSAFVMLLNVVQLMFGLPTSSFLLRAYCQKCIKNGTHLSYEPKKLVPINFTVLKPIPAKYNTKWVLTAKLAACGLIASAIAAAFNASSYASVFALLIGIIAKELGFLDEAAASKAGIIEFLNICFYIKLVAAFSSLTVERLLSFIVPMVVLLLVGLAGLILGAVLMSRLVKVDPLMAAAFAPAAMFGYPFSQFLTEDVVKGMGLPEEESQKLLAMLMPQMVIAGFTTCTVASVVLAGIVGPMI